MYSLRTRARCIQGLCCLAITLLSACANGPNDQKKLPHSQLAFPESAGVQPILASRAAVFAGESLHISYLDGDQEIAVSGPLLPATSPDRSLRPLIPPIVRFEPLEPRRQKSAVPGESVSIQSVAAWQALILQLQQEIVDMIPGQGMVLDVLRQEDIFLFFMVLDHLVFKLRQTLEHVL